MITISRVMSDPYVGIFRKKDTYRRRKHIVGTVDGDVEGKKRQNIVGGEILTGTLDP